MVQRELTLKAKALAVLEVPTGDTLQDTEVGKNFENSIGISPSNNRWDYMKIKIFFRAKQRTSRVGENFSSYTSNKKLVARIYKELKK